MPSESSKSTPIPHAKQLLVPVSPERGFVDYLAELAELLPHSISQFGLVLTTAVELQQAPGEQVRSKDPRQPKESSGSTGVPPPPPHYRSIQMPIVTAAVADPAKTLIDMTISGHAITFFPRCEENFMEVTVNEDTQMGPLDSSKIAESATEANAASYLKMATADPVIVAHDQNVRMLLSSVVEYLHELRASGGKAAFDSMTKKVMLTALFLLLSRFFFCGIDWFNS